MSNNYLEFSTAINNCTEQEKDWIRRQMELVLVKIDEETGFAVAFDTMSGDSCNDTFKTEYFLIGIATDDGECAEFTAIDEGDLYWFSCQESGSPENLAILIQMFLKKFRPKECFSFQWAYWCSKPRLEEQGGGAAFITADRIEYMNTDSWRLDQEDKFREKK